MTTSSARIHGDWPPPSIPAAIEVQRQEDRHRAERRGDEERAPVEMPEVDGERVRPAVVGQERAIDERPQVGVESRRARPGFGAAVGAPPAPGEELAAREPPEQCPAPQQRVAPLPAFAEVVAALGRPLHVAVGLVRRQQQHLDRARQVPAARLRDVRPGPVTAGRQQHVPRVRASPRDPDDRDAAAQRFVDDLPRPAHPARRLPVPQRDQQVGLPQDRAPGGLVHVAVGKPLALCSNDPAVQLEYRGGEPEQGEELRLPLRGVPGPRRKSSRYSSRRNGSTHCSSYPSVTASRAAHWSGPEASAETRRTWRLPASPGSGA